VKISKEGLLIIYLKCGKRKLKCGNPNRKEGDKFTISSVNEYFIRLLNIHIIKKAAKYGCPFALFIGLEISLRHR